MRQGAFQGVARGRVRGGRRRRRGLALALAVAVGAGAGVGGCSSQAESSPPVVEEPRPTASPAPPEPTPTQTPEPVAEPVPPPAMEQADEAGALAAAEYVLAVFEYTFASGDTEAWDELSADDCPFCVSVTEDVSTVYSGGGRFIGSEVLAQEPRVLAYDSTLGVYAIEVAYRVAPGQQLSGGGMVVEEVPPEDGFLILDLAPTTGGWRLLNIATSDTRFAG
nr:DUF6318 family protein [uncultured Actinotalea sp.]